MLIAYLVVGVIVLATIVYVAVKMDWRDKQTVTIPESFTVRETETIPFQYNDKGELLDRISGEPITRFPLF